MTLMKTIGHFLLLRHVPDVGGEFCMVSLMLSDELVTWPYSRADRWNVKKRMYMTLGDVIAESLARHQMSSLRV
nr:hypothetical protein BgiMline_007865 [Biomphalaria glabrata]